MREDDGKELGDSGGDGTAPPISPIISNHSNTTFTTTSTNHSNTTFTSVITVN